MPDAATLSQIVRFGCVGILATGVHYGVALAVSLVASPYVGNLAGYCAAVGVSYTGHRRFTFRIEPEAAAHGRRLPRFLATSLSALLLSQLVLAATTAIGWPEAIALAAAVLTKPPYTFLLHRIWVFR